MSEELLLKFMEWTETQQEIERAIKTLCTGMKPFVTADEIAETTSYSKQTVLNNADAVVRRSDVILKETVGQANVYFVKRNRMDEVSDSESTLAVSRLSDTNGQAEYVTLDSTDENSQFDLEAHWYDWDANEIEGYHPNAEEMGRAAEMYGPDPFSIRLWEPDEVEFEDETTEEN